MDRSLGIILPAYQPNPDVLLRYAQELTEALDPAALIVELDAADDDLKESLTAIPGTVHTVSVRRGKGAAITAGFEQLETDILAFIDADASTPVKSVSDILAPIQTGRADLAVGSRRHPDARIKAHQTYARRWLGHGFAWLARRILDVSLYDYQCGAKAISREAWEAVRTHLYEPGFAWDIELIAMTDALGFEIAEIPIEWEDQPGSTVAPLHTAYALGRALFIARHRARLLRDDRLHTALEAYRDDAVALVDQPGWNDD